MALLSKLKSILGIGGSPENEERTDTSVTVEHEATDRTNGDHDEKDSDAAESTDQTGDAADEAVAAGTDASASTASLTETGEPETETATEPAEAAGPPTDPLDDEPTDREVDDVIDEAEDNESDDDPEESADAAELDNAEPSNTADLTAIKGIGPAYSDRLNSAGIDSVGALAAADAETLGEQIDVSPKIVSDWIDRATDQ